MLNIYDQYGSYQSYKTVNMASYRLVINCPEPEGLCKRFYLLPNGKEYPQFEGLPIVQINLVDDVFITESDFPRQKLILSLLNDPSRNVIKVLDQGLFYHFKTIMPVLQVVSISENRISSFKLGYYRSGTIVHEFYLMDGERDPKELGLPDLHWVDMDFDDVDLTWKFADSTSPMDETLLTLFSVPDYLEDNSLIHMNIGERGFVIFKSYQYFGPEVVWNPDNLRCKASVEKYDDDLIFAVVARNEKHTADYSGVEWVPFDYDIIHHRWFFNMKSPEVDRVDEYMKDGVIMQLLESKEHKQQFLNSVRKGDGFRIKIDYKSLEANIIEDTGV